jgi:hypothetical protein
MSETVLFNHEFALTMLNKYYVPFPEPGPPKTKNISAGGGGSTFIF